MDLGLAVNERQLPTETEKSIGPGSLRGLTIDKVEFDGYGLLVLHFVPADAAPPLVIEARGDVESASLHIFTRQKSTRVIEQEYFIDRVLRP